MNSFTSMDSFSYLRYASNLARIREEKESSHLHDTLAKLAGVSPGEYVAPWMKAAMMIGSSGLKRERIVYSDDNTQVLFLMENNLGACVIVHGLKVAGRTLIQSVKTAKMSFDLLVQHYESRHSNEKLKEVA